MRGTLFVAVNARGYRIGQGHWFSKLSDREIDAIRELHEDHGHSYSMICEWFGLSKSAVAMICRYERRAHTIAGHRAVHVSRKRKGENAIHDHDENDQA